MVTPINLAEKLARFRDRWSPKIIADLNDSHVGAVTLGPGELVVILKGVEHRPLAREECHLMLIEPKATRDTGSSPSFRRTICPATARPSANRRASVCR
jgi:mannose-6-phosphate isomerase-like protein (cupin superfamily)